MISVVDEVVGTIAVAKVVENYLVGLNFGVSGLKLVADVVYLGLAQLQALVEGVCCLIGVLLVLDVVEFHLLSCEAAVIILVFGGLHALCFVVLLVVGLGAHFFMLIQLQPPHIPRPLLLPILPLLLPLACLLLFVMELRLLFNDGVAGQLRMFTSNRGVLEILVFLPFQLN